jgi:multisite-specific tRNA:(cytosine-C5)-methyltransferase
MGATVHGLLKELFPKVNEEGQGDVIGEIESQVREMKMGCCVLKVEPGESEDDFSERMVFPRWKCRFSCNLMLPKEERKYLTTPQSILPTTH